MQFLALNAGSSSLKMGLFLVDEREEKPLLSAEIQRIGNPPANFFLKSADQIHMVQQILPEGTFEEAMQFLFSWLDKHSQEFPLALFVHRIVQGGPALRQPAWVDTHLLQTLSAYVPYDPEHLPQQIEALRLCQKKYPAIPQIACFDTGFYRSMPSLAQRYPLPRNYQGEGLIRYGFHGLSYESILQTMERKFSNEASQRLIAAHLGNGASMSAIHRGKPIDTSMGFSPAGGLMMGTRCGDLDPGVFLFLLEEKGFSAEELRSLFHAKSGLLAISEQTSEMKDLIEESKKNRKAAEAIDLYCYLAKKQLGALLAALGGVDTLVFTGGIGEKAPLVRSKICEGLGFLDIEIDEQKNALNEEEISSTGSSVKVRVIPTNEQRIMVRHGYRILSQEKIPQ